MGIRQLSSVSRLTLFLSSIMVLLTLSCCGSNSTINNTQPLDSGNDSSYSAVPENSNTSSDNNARYTVNVRDTTGQMEIPDAVINRLYRNGFSFNNGFDYDLARAYDGSSPMSTSTSYIVITENRKDVQKIAEGMRDALGVGEIIQEASNVEGWRYDGDILLVLGEELVDLLPSWDLWPSDNLPYTENNTISYWVSLRNATSQGLLANSTMLNLVEAGLNESEGYSYDVGNAYLIDPLPHSPYNKKLLQLDETLIIIREDRDELRTIARTMKDIIGVGTIIEDNDHEYAPGHDGDILILLGSDSASTQ